MKYDARSGFETETTRASSPAPERRESREQVAARVAALTANPLVKVFLEAADISVMLLSETRQILVGNSALLQAFAVEGMDLVTGARPGEALGCVHALESPRGCGTAPECSVCGAALAVLASQRSRETVDRECLLTLRRGAQTEAIELHVRASPVEIEGERYTVVGLRDISAEKRREALERVFLHDVSNTVSPLLVSAMLLADRVADEDRGIAERVTRLAHRLRRDIEEQRVLLEAEKGTLKVERADVCPEEALKAAIAVLDGGPQAEGRSIEIVPAGPLTRISTDESLLVRVLVNMLKNAFEATPAGGAVRASAEMRGAACEFRVWNPGSMPPETALQVFKRSFTTKGDRSRGLGTFSIRLLGERYLGGKVGFTSTAADGTTFFVRLPA